MEIFMNNEIKLLSQDLTGLCALVTGSSRGIGSAIAVELAAHGAEVWLHAAASAAKAELVKAQIEAHGGICRGIITADLTDPSAAEHIAETVGGVDILVLNASLQIKEDYTEITREDYEKQMNCNFYASMKLITAFAEGMKQKHFGRIITIGSVQEAKPHPQMLVYSSSKAAQTAMVKSLASVLSGDGITLNNIAPGVIYTDRNVEALSDPEYAKKVTDSIPLGFYGEKQDISPLVCLLASEAGRYITGQSIYIDGGKSL